MAYISDQDAAIFKEASIPAIDNFTKEDLEQIGKLAQELKPILEAAKKRKQDSLKKKAS